MEAELFPQEYLETMTKTGLIVGMPVKKSSISVSGLPMPSSLAPASAMVLCSSVVASGPPSLLGPSGLTGLPLDLLNSSSTSLASLSPGVAKGLKKLRGLNPKIGLPPCC